ncbi:MAG TPA: type II toxin-antitoxin system prevent-host-death family antitoxin [Gemmatimonadaceae bacterium]|nr:type II toxin-antitoxin system prevent-host-death family antitoxin [Gemmatimonadaceae bacterium]
MRTTGIRDLKNNLSRYLRRLRPGQVITITDHGRVVAELRAAGAGTHTAPLPTHSRYAQLLEAGLIRPAVETGDPLADWPSTRAVSLPRGTVTELVDEDRGA